MSAEEELAWEAERDERRFAADDAKLAREHFGEALDVAAEIVRKLDVAVPYAVTVKVGERIDFQVTTSEPVESFARSVFKHLMPKPKLSGDIVSYSRELYGCDVTVWGSASREDRRAQLVAELAELDRAGVAS